MGESFSGLTLLSGSVVADSDYLLIQDASADSGSKSKRILMSELWAWIEDKLTTGTSQVISVADGAADAPILRFADESDTGFYRAASRRLGVAVHGVESCLFSDVGPVFTAALKGTTGDPTGVEGLLTINTDANVIKIYADGGWRTLASW